MLTRDAVTNETYATKKGVTLADVARYAGVKPMTVSRALNGGNVSPGLRESVLRAVEELGYRPNLAARTMASRKSMLVGVLTQNDPHLSVSHPLNWAFMMGINDGLAHSGYTLCQVRITDVAEDGGLSAPVFQGHLLDGLIVVNSVPEQLVPRIGELVPQCVWLDSNVWHEENCIRRDEAEAARLAARKVIEAGHQSLWCITGAEQKEPHFSLRLRLEAVRQEADREGLPLRIVHMPVLSDWPDGDWKGAQELVASCPQGTGIIAENIYVAETWLEAALYAGRVPGDDFGLACADDTVGKFTALARVRFDRYALGKRAAAMLLQKLKQPDLPCPSELVPDEWLPGKTLTPVEKEISY